MLHDDAVGPGAIARPFARRRLVGAAEHALRRALRRVDRAADRDPGIVRIKGRFAKSLDISKWILSVRPSVEIL